MIRYEKEFGDIVIDGWDQGVASSPHKGIANMQAVNIYTESGEVMTNIPRVLQSQPGDTTTPHTINAVDSAHLSTSFQLINGSWINISASSISGLSTGNYYIQNSNGTPTTAAGSFQVSQFYNGTLTGGLGSTGTATFTLVAVPGKIVAKAKEDYDNGASAFTRYYMLDANGLVWVYDTRLVNNPSQGLLHWFLPDASKNYYGSESAPSGMAIYNGWLHVFSGSTIWCKPTVSLASTSSASTNWNSFASGLMMSSPVSPNTHPAFVGHQGRLYYCDGVFLGMVFADSSLLTKIANIQSYCSYTSSSTTGTASLINGSIPYNGTDNSVRIPAAFFAEAGGSVPSALVQGTIYYIKWLASGRTFEVYTAATAGSALDITTGASGSQYFNTYYPISTSGKQSITFAPQRLNLPEFETAQCIGEIGNILLVGGLTNAIYPWSQQTATPDTIIPTPEANIVKIQGVNNVAYFTAGNKANIYVTNGTIASLATCIPDYAAGVPGTPASYIEPYFVWGDIMYLRGRVYVSVLDETSTKAGNCGGIWSFIPSQNYFIGDDTGIALRLENQSSYATYSGYCTALLPLDDQQGQGPQYFSGWQSSVSSPTYGIDMTSSGSGTVAVIETDLIPLGTYVDKGNFSHVQTRYPAPLASGESVTVKYRTNITSAWSSFTDTTAGVDNNAGSIGFRWPLPASNMLQIQLQITLTPISSSASSNTFVRLKEVRIGRGG